MVGTIVISLLYRATDAIGNERGEARAPTALALKCMA